MRPLWTLYRSIPASSCIKSLRAADEDDACWTRLPLLALLLMKMSCTFSGAPRAESGLCCASCGRPCDSPAHTPELPAATAPHTAHGPPSSPRLPGETLGDASPPLPLPLPLPPQPEAAEGAGEEEGVSMGCTAEAYTCSPRPSRIFTATRATKAAAQ